MDHETRRRRSVDLLAAALSGWLAGILIASIYKINYLYTVPIVIAIGIFLFPNRKGKHANNKHAKVLVEISTKATIIFFTMISVAIFRYSLTDRALDYKSSVLPYGQKVTVAGKVVRSSEAGTNGSQFVIKAGFGKNKEKIKILVREDLSREYEYGDTLEVRGMLEKPEPFETESGETFDYPNYLKKDSIVGILKASDTSLVKKGEEANPLRVLSSFNNKLESTAKTLMPGQGGMLATGVLLGDRAITRENQDDFITTGTVHIIALSGYNVSIVANFFRELFSFLPLAGGLAVGGLAILLFVIMTGLQSTAVRAGIMAGIVLFAKAKGREAPIGRVIALAAFLITLLNPYTLYYDVSSQLSFIATIGIIYFAPTIGHWFSGKPFRVPEKFLGLPLREIITGTIGTQIFVLPFLLFKTANLSFISPITNILIMPLIPYLMVLGAVVAVLGALYLPLGMPFAFLGDIVADVILFFINTTAQIPFAAVKTKLSFLAMITIYAFLFWYFEPFKSRDHDKT